jgi:hypothetical protein
LLRRVFIGGEKPPEEPSEEAEEPVISIGNLLRVVDENEYWVAYESPSEHALSLAWGGGSLWLADIYDGKIYRVREVEGSLEIVGSWDLRIQPSNVFQMRDITWDGYTLWSTDWGSIQKHDPETLEVVFIYNEAEQEPPFENMHHMWNIAWDGEYIWTSPGQLNRHNKDDYHVEAVYPAADAPVFPMNMAFREKGDLWVCDAVWGYIFEIDLSKLPPQGYPRLDIETCDCYDLEAELPDEAIPKVRNTYSIFSKPYGIAWSESNLWVYDLVTRRIYKVKKLPNKPLDPRNHYYMGDKEPSELYVSGEMVLTLENSPYVFEKLEVPEGSVLRIEPGVEIYINNEVIIQGKLIAIGTPEKPIIFSHIKWDEPASGYFSFGDPQNIAVYPEGVEASASILKYVIIQFFQGLGARNALPKFEYCIIERVPGISITLEDGVYSSIEFVGNLFREGSGGIGIRIGPGAKVGEIKAVGNVFRNADAVPIYIEYRGDNPPKVFFEHNIIDHIFGAFNIFDGEFEAVVQHNYINDLVAYRGFMPSRRYRNVFSYNYMRHVFQAGIQLDDPIHFGEVEITYNTIIDCIVDSNYGEPDIKIEYNNIIFSPEVEIWAGGVDEVLNVTASMPRNWWGTSDIDEIKKHIISNRDGVGPLIIEPILERPNGIGFLKGLVVDRSSSAPVPEARIVLPGGDVIFSSVSGEFFTALPEGNHIIRVSASGYGDRDVSVSIESGRVSDIRVEL